MSFRPKQRKKKREKNKAINWDNTSSIPKESSLTFNMDPYSLVEGVDSPIIPLTTFSDDSPSRGELVSNDDLQTLHLYFQVTV